MNTYKLRGLNYIVIEVNEGNHNFKISDDSKKETEFEQKN